ncbi:hypothetical protein EYF80_024824 [Liparis tanakae]|uniref:Uncharacterized protein n=1 Tax=Liparis tanakae TaxID=230148 RepID=A0A4Z2HHD4_9TELE|nr:hypothetical protein EYF80_024824 [Liparis tanakae]
MPPRISSTDRTSSTGFLSGSTGGICSSFFACSVAISTACRQTGGQTDGCWSVMSLYVGGFSSSLTGRNTFCRSRPVMPVRRSRTAGADTASRLASMRIFCRLWYSLASRSFSSSAASSAAYTNTHGNLLKFIDDFWHAFDHHFHFIRSIPVVSALVPEVADPGPGVVVSLHGGGA